MHKLRGFLPPLPDSPPGVHDLYHSNLRLVAIPRENLKITYDFERHVQPILDAMSRKACRPLTVHEGYVVVPIHELQVGHIQDKFDDAKVYPPEYSLPLLGQQSVR